MVNLRNIMYAVYGVSNPERTARFMADFGLKPALAQADRIYMRGTCDYPFIYCAEQAAVPGLRSVGFELASEADLQRAAQLPGATAIAPFLRPGGGQWVQVEIPGGITLDLVYGNQRVEPLAARAALPLNEGERKNRFNAPQRPPRTACEVMRLGHMAIGVPDPVRARDWVIEHLGMRTSDAIMVPGNIEEPIGFFMRFDHGSTPVDHHTLLLAKSNGPAAVHHMSFELQDLDAVWMGHEWMQSQGHAAHWGVGRHVLGSQIFDYWWEPDGFRVEHYTDGDLFDNTVEPRVVEGTNDQLWTWGPHVPETFFDETRHA